MADAVILVEGESDQAALVAAAQVLGMEIDDGWVLVMDGVTNTRRILRDQLDRNRRVAGLFDAPEHAHVARALAAVGLSNRGDAESLARSGFFACGPDLESELIAALGAERVLAVVERQGDDGRRLRSLQQMPEWRNQPVELQLRRWFGSGGSRKLRYASLLVAAMSPQQIPQPLRRVLEYAVADPQGP